MGGCLLVIKKNYKTDDERTKLLNDALASGKRLIEDAILTNESYLLFVDADETEPYVFEQAPPEPSYDDYLLDLDFRLSMIELGI